MGIATGGRPAWKGNLDLSPAELPARRGRLRDSGLDLDLRDGFQHVGDGTGGEAALAQARLVEPGDEHDRNGGVSRASTMRVSSPVIPGR